MGDDTADPDDDHYRDIDALHQLVEERSHLPRGSTEWKAVEARESQIMRKIWRWGRNEPEAD